MKQCPLFGGKITLNDYRFQLEVADQMDKFSLDDTLKMSMYLSKTISLALPEGYPRDAALKLFGQDPPAPKKGKTYEQLKRKQNIRDPNYTL